MTEVRHIIPISGKDSLATALVQLEIQPDLPYEFVFNSTGVELPEVFEWLANVEKYLGKPIVRLEGNLEAIIESYGFFLPNARARYCTKEAKIEPFVKWVGKSPAIVYYGIRADEEREGFNNKTSPNITPKYPLKELGIDMEAVYQIINARGLKPPTFFWQSVYESVCRILDIDVRGRLKEWQFDMLFSWRSRANCYFCFNQRLYELVGLLEHHPDLFDKAESYEYMGSEKPYYWKYNYPMKKIRENAPKIKRKRIEVICKAIVPSIQKKLFSDEPFDDEFFVDVLAVKSCGLFCGK
jgi:hypothetical protein